MAVYVIKGKVNCCNQDANFASLDRLFHILVPQKEKAFCPCIVFILGNLTSVLVLQRLQKVQALFLLQRSDRYFGARLYKDLKIVALVYQSTAV